MLKRCHAHILPTQKAENFFHLALFSQETIFRRGLDAELPVSGISGVWYLAFRSIDGVLAHHRERVRKAVAAFFSTGHSLGTLVAQLLGQCMYWPKMF
jgi:hypothetical protein